MGTSTKLQSILVASRLRSLKLILEERVDYFLSFFKVPRKMILPGTTSGSSEQTKVLGPTTLNVPRNGIVHFTFAIPIFITRLSIKVRSSIQDLRIIIVYIYTT